MSDLQDPQKEALANYQAITETWDTDRAVEMLQRCDWDVTRASSEFFSLGTAAVTHQAFEPFPNNFLGGQEPQRPRSDSWGKTIHSMVASLWKSIVPEEIRGEKSRSARIFSSRMQEQGRVPMNFSSLEFQELLMHCFEEEKLLLVYVHAFNDQYPQELFSDIRLVRVLDKEFVCWGVDSSTEEGQMLKKELRIEVFPCIVLLKVKDPKKPEVLEKKCGYLDSRDLLSLIEKYISTASLELLQERRLRELQQEELKEAEMLTLRRDRERKEKEEGEKKEEERKLVQKAQRKCEVMHRIGIEPEIGHDTAQVSFKLPSGKRIERRFAKTEPVQMLYDYLESLDIIASELTTGFPSTILSNRENSLEAEGIFPKSVIHVREANI